MAAAASGGETHARSTSGPELRCPKAAARKANDGWRLEPGSGTPREYVIVYGGFYSLVLGLAYLPARAVMRRQGVRIRDALLGDPPGVVSELSDWKEVRESLDEILRLKTSGLESLGPRFSVLAPLLVGWISLLLGPAPE